MNDCTALSENELGIISYTMQITTLDKLRPLTRHATKCTHALMADMSDK